MAAVASSAAAQDFSDPKYAKWGETPEERKENMLASSYLKEETANRHFNSAARYLQLLLEKCPSASENIYVNGVKLYKDKANRAETLAEKKVYVDSILYLYDVRIENVSETPAYPVTVEVTNGMCRFYATDNFFLTFQSRLILHIL